MKSWGALAEEVYHIYTLDTKKREVILDLIMTWFEHAAFWSGVNSWKRQEYPNCAGAVLSYNSLLYNTQHKRNTYVWMAF